MIVRGPTYARGWAALLVDCLQPCGDLLLLLFGKHALHIGGDCCPSDVHDGFLG